MRCNHSSNLKDSNETAKFAVSVRSGQEMKAKTLIYRRIKHTELENLVTDIYVPTNKTYTVKEGKKIYKEKALYQGYVIITAKMTYTLREAILGLKSVFRILDEVEELLDPEKTNNDKIKTSTQFSRGQVVRVVSGPFANFEGRVEKFNHTTNKLFINILVFGRNTSTEVSLDQIERHCIKLC